MSLNKENFLNHPLEYSDLGSLANKLNIIVPETLLDILPFDQAKQKVIAKLTTILPQVPEEMNEQEESFLRLAMSDIDYINQYARTITLLLHRDLILSQISPPSLLALVQWHQTPSMLNELQQITCEPIASIPLAQTLDLAQLDEVLEHVIACLFGTMPDFLVDRFLLRISPSAVIEQTNLPPEEAAQLAIYLQQAFDLVDRYPPLFPAHEAQNTQVDYQENISDPAMESYTDEGLAAHEGQNVQVDYQENISDPAMEPYTDEGLAAVEMNEQADVALAEDNLIAQEQPYEISPEFNELSDEIDQALQVEEAG